MKMTIFQMLMILLRNISAGLRRLYPLRIRSVPTEQIFSGLLEVMFESHNMQDVIDEMKSLRVVSVEGKRKQIYTTPTSFHNSTL